MHRHHVLQRAVLAATLGAAILLLPQAPAATLTGSYASIPYNYTGYTWTDGTPTVSATGSKTGVFIIGVTNGFALSLPADTTPRTVKVYVGLHGAKENFQAYLSVTNRNAAARQSFFRVETK